MRLTSGYENHHTANALADIISSPTVWLCGAGLEAVEVDCLSSSATFRSFGRPDRVELDIRSHGEVAML